MRSLSFIFRLINGEGSPWRDFERLVPVCVVPAKGRREETVVSRERGRRHRDVHAKVNAQLPARRYPTLTPSHRFLPSSSYRQGEKPRVGAWTPSGCCSSKGCSRHRAAYPRRSASAFQAECPLCLRSGGQVKGGRLRMSSACVCVCR